jgi:hypothetical protein
MSGLVEYIQTVESRQALLLGLTHVIAIMARRLLAQTKVKAEALTPKQAHSLYRP